MEYGTALNTICILEGALEILSLSDGHTDSRWCGDVGNIIQMATSVVPSLARMYCLERQTCTKKNALGVP